MNRLGINLWNWSVAPMADIPALIRRAAKLGFTAVELPMLGAELPLEAIRSTLAETGMEVTLCAGSSPERSLASFEEVQRTAARTFLTDCLGIAETLGAKVLCGPMYGGRVNCRALPPGEAAREWELAVTGLSALAPLAADAGCVLALEPLHRYRTSMVNTAGQALRLVSDIGHKAVGVHFDTFHANMEERNVPAALRSVLEGGKLYHVHACGNDRGAPGTGHLPWGDIFTVLRRGGYTGHVTMETFCPGGMDAAWHSPDLGPDQVAKDGLACLLKWLAGPA